MYIYKYIWWVQEFITNYDPYMASNAEYNTDIDICMVKCALREINLQLADVKQRLIITHSPANARSVRAKSDIKPETLTLVPMSTSISNAKLNAPVPDNVIVASLDDGQHIYVKATYPTVAKDASREMPMGKATHEFVTPFWCIESTTDPTVANMSFKLVTVTVGSREITIPCLTNHKAIGGHDHLVVLRVGAKKWEVPKDAPQDMLKKKARKSK